MNIPKPTINTDAAHSKYSPSGSKRWIECPASISMIDSMPEQPERYNFYAEEGTAAHELASFCLEEEIEPISQYGKTFNDFTVDKEMARQVKKYTDYVRGQLNWENHLWIESQVNLHCVVSEMFGTADAILVGPDSLEIIDLKYGRGVVVEPKENTQMMLYAIGVLAHLAKHKIYLPDESVIKLTIAQPRAPHVEGSIRTWETDLQYLRNFRLLCKAAIVDSKTENPTFGPGEDQCRWCEASPVCKAYAQYTLSVAQLEFADFAKSPKEFKETLINNQKYLSDAELIQIIKHAKAAKTWFDSMIEHATRKLQNGEKVKGYKLVYGRSIRTWEDTVPVKNILIDYGVDEERLYNSKFRSPAQLEKELDDEEFELIKALVFKPTGKITIAPEEDGRPAVNSNTAAQADWAKENF